MSINEFGWFCMGFSCCVLLDGVLRIVVMVCSRGDR